MITILILAALFTGAGIYTAENSKVYNEPRKEFINCEKQGENTVCYKGE